MIAALFVMPDGPYAGLPGVDVWDKKRDARKYAGPWPVVAHPPCERWGRYYWGGPSIAKRGLPHFKLGDDDGCFAAALAAVIRWGGVLEHPADSHAWTHFDLMPPAGGGWSVAEWAWGGLDVLCRSGKLRAPCQQGDVALCLRCRSAVA